ncbi:MAG: DUF4920 domain-containing protein [Bdellovibrionales bacterium]|jgi:hypothetical protein|nr:DUF4920 domain-containing protein [Bdellovibrionales bacterium]MBT3525154.1 DUF4920 domain-containing protein [Bdellovibrionales bacterium]MBT7669225.1 DUF4920 domain-containing protein [Bdellovibrionales bacterium]MBT7767979.1 DUF4920 domain-containing protein [Bdellovibrionales bacterium]
MKLLILIFTLLITSTLSAAPSSFGIGANCDQATPISKILKSPDQYIGQRMVVTGHVIKVCAKRGCWMTLASDQKYQDLRIKVKDGVMVFPLTARGKKACVQGDLEEINLSEKHAKKYLAHQAKEQKKDFDSSSVKGPMTIYQLRAKGAVIQ